MGFHPCRLDFFSTPRPGEVKPFWKTGGGLINGRHASVYSIPVTSKAPLGHVLDEKHRWRVVSFGLNPVANVSSVAIHSFCSRICKMRSRYPKTLMSCIIQHITGPKGRKMTPTGQRVKHIFETHRLCHVNVMACSMDTFPIGASLVSAPAVARRTPPTFARPFRMSCMREPQTNVKRSPTGDTDWRCA